MLNGRSACPNFPPTRAISVSAQISVTGFSPLGDESNNPQHGTTNVYQLTDNLTWVHGKSSGEIWLRFPHPAAERLSRCGVARIHRFHRVDHRQRAGGVAAGLANRTPAARPSTIRSICALHSYDFFVNDTWRVRPNLTLILGLRYEYNSPAVDAAESRQSVRSGDSVAGAGGHGGMPRGGYVPDRNNFAPRVGFAWTPGGRRNTVLRGGYGIYYDQSSLAPGEGLYFSPPYFNFKRVLSARARLLRCCSRIRSRRNFPLPTPPSALDVPARSAHALRPAMELQFRAFARRQPACVEVGYVGSKGTGLIGARDINQPRAHAPIRNLRPVPQFADINLLESNRNSVYHSLQARFEQRLDFGLSLLASYTWRNPSTMDPASFPAPAIRTIPQNSYNLRAERGLSNFDVRQRLAVSYAYDLPFGKGHLAGLQRRLADLRHSAVPERPAVYRRAAAEFRQQQYRNRQSGFRRQRPAQTSWAIRASVRPPAQRNGSIRRRSSSRRYGTFGNAGRNIGRRTRDRRR